MSKKIVIKQISSEIFEVTINASTQTVHEVIIKDTFINRIQPIDLSKKQILYKSIEFLLSKEPNSAILKKFNIEIIPTYFPEFNNLFN